MFPRPPDHQGRQRDDDRRAAQTDRETAKTRERERTASCFTIQQKFSLPAACLVLALIGLALGVSNRKDGKLASFVLGIGVVFVYYILLYAPRAAALGGRISARLAPWIANIVLGVAGIALVVWRAGSADQPIRLSMPTFWRRRRRRRRRRRQARSASPSRRRVVLVVRVPHIDLAASAACSTCTSRASICAFSCWRSSRWSASSTSRRSSIWRTSCSAAWRRSAMLLRYFYFATPQYVYYIIPMAALVATLVTIGAADEEQRADRDARVRHQPVPVGAAAAALRAAVQRRLFELQEQVLADRTARRRG